MVVELTLRPAFFPTMASSVQMDDVCRCGGAALSNGLLLALGRRFADLGFGRPFLLSLENLEMDSAMERVERCGCGRLAPNRNRIKINARDVALEPRGSRH